MTVHRIVACPWPDCLRRHQDGEPWCPHCGRAPDDPDDAA